LYEWLSPYVAAGSQQRIALIAVCLIWPHEHLVLGKKQTVLIHD